MRDAFFITLTLVIGFVILGYAYNLASPYLVKLGVIEKPEKAAALKPDGGVFRSEDFGRIWAQANATTDGGELEKSDVFALQFSPIDSRMLYAATSKGLFVSQDSGNNWRNILDERIMSAEEEVIAFAIDPESPERMYVAAAAAGKRSRILKTKGAGFYEVYSTAAADNKISGLFIDSYDPSAIYAGTAKGLLLISRDFGESWGILHEFTAPIYDVEMLPSDTRIIYTAANGIIFRSRNQGMSWEEIWQESSRIALINDLAIDPHNEKIIYAATSGGFFKSVNGGISFEKVKLPIGIEAVPVSAVFASAVKKNLLLLAIDSQIYKSDDAGFTWQIQALNTSRKISVIQIKPDDLRVIFAGVRQ